MHRTTITSFLIDDQGAGAPPMMAEIIGAVDPGEHQHQVLHPPLPKEGSTRKLERDF